MRLACRQAGKSHHYRKKLSLLSYILLLTFLVAFSYGFVDPNFPYQPPEFLHDLVFTQRGLATVLYSTIILALFVFYGFFLHRIGKKKLDVGNVWRLIFISTGILFFAFPAFSFDIFNYIATAKVTYLYRENPYIVMPVEIPNEPMLAFLHAANKIALYGFSWILLTAMPHFLGFGNLLLTIFTFKAFVIAFYLVLSFLIWKMSKQSVFSLAFFALNPLVLIETLVSGHNDVVMMFFALLSFYLLKKRQVLASCLSLLVSIFVKYSTIFILPVYLYILLLNYKNRKIEWSKVYFWSAISMYIIFFLSPLREEMYSWYLIWPLSFVALVVKARLSILYKALLYITLAFSFGLLFRFAPFVYTREWSRITPIIKILATWVPVIFALFYLIGKKYVQKA
jgi:hypothetical protein